jgi:hypothetical protein
MIAMIIEHYQIITPACRQAGHQIIKSYIEPLRY